MTRYLPWLEDDTPFPDPAEAFTDPPGLLAAGGGLSTDRLRSAYRRGIFPWCSADDPLLWWSPDPRCVIAPADFRATRSLRQAARRPGITLSADRAFTAVMAGCAAPRPYADDTWISPDIQAAYQALHASGDAHSLEVWQDGGLVGGLYGVQVGNVFCGESMFSTQRDASKLAFWALMQLGRHWGQRWVDCQLVNDHLLSLGAVTLRRADWLEHLDQEVAAPAPDWRLAERVLATQGFHTA